MFEKFPKVRPELPREFQEVYDRQYKENREGRSPAAGVAQKLESWMHRKVASDVANGAAKSTLEIGAGTLNHLRYEPRGHRYDVVEPFDFLFESSDQLPFITQVYKDISDITGTEIYERVISIASFEHICNLPEVVARCGLLLQPGGTLRVGIPSEGTVLWRLGYKLTTGLEFRRRYGLDYEVLMRHEHVNTASEIEEILRFFFKDVGISFFGLLRSLSIYQFLYCKIPDRKRCNEYLGGR